MTAPAPRYKQSSIMASGLAQTFKLLSAKASRLTQVYRRWRKSSQELDKELERRNRQLEADVRRESAVSTSLRHILHSLAVGIIVVDLQGMITTIDRAAEGITKLAAADAQSLSIDQLLSALGSHTCGFHCPVDRPQTFEQVVSREEGPRHLSFKLAPLQGDTEEHWGAVIIVDDVTQQKYQAEQAQRAKWLNAIRKWPSALPRR